MEGKRVELAAQGEGFKLPNPGEYAKWIDGNWFCRTPNGMVVDLSRHDVVEYEDGTISVSPSILATRWDNVSWHGYLERGVWREC